MEEHYGLFIMLFAIKQNIGDIMFDFSGYKDKKVFITGHTGFKGSWLSMLLIEAGAVVSGYSLDPPTDPSLFDLIKLNTKMTSYIGDIRDYDNLEKVMKKEQPEIVFHLAAQPIVRESYRNPRFTFDTNIMGTVNVLECIRNLDCVESVVIITTDKVYRNDGREEGYKEDDFLCGYDPYSNSKSCADLVTSSYINSFFQAQKLPVSILRAGNVIGGGDFAIDRLIPDCIRSLETREPVIIRNPKATRPFQHVLEPVCAYAMIALKQMEDYSFAGAYNIGPDESEVKSVSEVLYLFNAAWNASGKSKSNPFHFECLTQDVGFHEAKTLALDNTKAKEVLGWKPKWTSYEAVRKTVEWVIEYQDGNDIYEIMKKQYLEYIG